MSRSPRVEVGCKNFLALLNRSDRIHDQLPFPFTPRIDRIERARATVIHPRDIWEHADAPDTSGNPVRLRDRERHLGVVIWVILREVRRKSHITEIEQRRVIALA